MSFAGDLVAPSWVSSGAVVTGGLDLLGLRLPVQFIGGTLLDGITTVTPAVRYMAFRAWLIHQYGQSGRPDNWQEFTNFSARIESALVLGNLLQDRSIRNLIGADDGLLRIEANTPTFAISALVKSPATTVYGNPSDQLGITRARDDNVPGLVAERGVPLASSVGLRLGKVPIMQRLLSDPNLAEVPKDDLIELGAVSRIDQIPDDERRLLVNAIVPEQPLAKERARVGTYASLLALASKLGTSPTEGDLLDAACSMARFEEPILDRIADGWTAYCVRDSLAVTQESVLSAVMSEILSSPDGGLAGVDRRAIVSGLMERVWEHDSALRELGVLDPDRSVADMSFRELYLRIESRVLAGSVSVGGIRRWPDALVERKLYKLAGASGAGALSLAVVAWILASLRVGEAVREGVLEYHSLSYQGWRRFGLREVILPELNRFHREDRSLRDVVAELAYRTVQQHLQITWSRLQVDLKRDVGLLTAESNKWFSRGKTFGGGRTQSRLEQAVGWLGQLKLIGDTGITTEGHQVLERSLRVLSEVGQA